MALPTTTAHKRDASRDTELSEAPAPKLAKVIDDTDASTHTVLGTPQPANSGLDDDTTGADTVDDIAYDNLAVSREDAASTLTEDKGKNKDADSNQNSEESGEDAASPVKEHIGDLFTAPDNAVLIHACNTVGSWGGGIAVEFRKRYPKAFQVYNKHCVSNHHPKTNPVPRGTCLLIPPCEVKLGAPKHWIGCLFTSAKYGRAKDPPSLILHHTTPAFKDLLGQLSRAPEITEVRMCQINAGLFAVPWKETKQALEDALATDASHKEVHVYSLASVTTSSHAGSVGFGNRRPARRPTKGQLPGGQSAPKGGSASTVQSILHSFISK